MGGVAFDVKINLIYAGVTYAKFRQIQSDWPDAWQSREQYSLRFAAVCAELACGFQISYAPSRKHFLLSLNLSEKFPAQEMAELCLRR